jgi:hypothetical protein
MFSSLCVESEVKGTFVMQVLSLLPCNMLGSQKSNLTITEYNELLKHITQSLVQLMTTCICFQLCQMYSHAS